MSKNKHDDNSSSSSSSSSSPSSSHKQHHLNITETNMMVSDLANTEKIVDSDKRRSTKTKKDSEKSKRDSHHHNESDDDKLDTYIDNNPIGINTMRPMPEYHQSMNPVNTVINDQTLPTTNKPTESEEKPESPEQIRLKKLDMLRKLSELAQAGCKLSQNYSMDSDYTTMKYEYEMHTGIRSKHNAVKWMQNIGINLVYGLEMANERYNPFDLKLKGWSEVMNSDIDGYYDVFGELYEKYQTPGKPMPPEIKLLFMISASAIKVHLTHTMAEQFAKPQEILSQNPQLMAQLRQQAIADKLAQQEKNQADKFKDKLNDQYKTVMQNAQDLNMLREQEELARKQQSQNATNVPDQSINNQPVMSPPTMNTMNSMNFQNKPVVSENEVPGLSGNMSNQQFTAFRNAEILQQKNQLEQRFLNEQKERQNTLNIPIQTLNKQKFETNRENIKDLRSEQSKVSINPKFDDILKKIEADITSSEEHKKPAKRGGGRKKYVKT